MSTLHHAIRIAASRPRIFRALTNADELSLWHLGEIEGSVATGATLTLTPRPGLTFTWRTDSVEADRMVVQTCIHGAGSSEGKRLTIQLSDDSDGLTTVKLSDGEWLDSDPHLAFCNTHWGDALNRLKHYLEQQ